MPSIATKKLAQCSPLLDAFSTIFFQSNQCLTQQPWKGRKHILFLAHTIGERIREGKGWRDWGCLSKIRTMRNMAKRIRKMKKCIDVICTVDTVFSPWCIAICKIGILSLSGGKIKLTRSNLKYKFSDCSWNVILTALFIILIWLITEFWCGQNFGSTQMDVTSLYVFDCLSLKQYTKIKMVYNLKEMIVGENMPLVSW